MRLNLRHISTGGYIHGDQDTKRSPPTQRDDFLWPVHPAVHLCGAGCCGGHWHLFSDERDARQGDGQLGVHPRSCAVGGCRVLPIQRVDP